MATQDISGSTSNVWASDPADARLLQFLQSLVRTKSTPGREAAIVEHMVAEMSDLGYDEAYSDDAGNAVGRIGLGPPVVLIDCHIDTVPLHSLEQWTHDPLGGEIVDGRLFGLGSSDMKASAAAAIHGAARLLPIRNRLKGTVYVVSSIAEEMMEGAALAATFDACDPDMVIIGEPSDLKLCVGQRGRAKIEVDVTGDACHAGHASAGINAAERMAEIIVAVAALSHSTHPVLGARSITCIDVHSEPYPSISMVPGFCRARFDCRFGPDETRESLVALLAEQSHIWDALPRPPKLDSHLYTAEFDTYTGRHYEASEFAASWYTPADSSLVQDCLRGLREGGLRHETATYGFCTNGSLTAGDRGVPTVGYGVGREEEAHTVDESISIENLFLGMRGYASMVAALLAAG